ncbi:hypothetical protein [Piscicoccus intestinalis]|nr:hypothetical protein [Piscicoccus intestinalis]
MDNTQLSSFSGTAARTWWWHPKPVAVSAASAMERSSDTWWWHPKPLA